MVHSRQMTAKILLLGIFAVIENLLAGNVSAEEQNINKAASFIEETIRFDANGKEIVGTLTRPSGPKLSSVPVVMILHGFAPLRDGLPVKGTDEGLFSRASHFWASRGYATLRFSTGGAQGSGGDLKDMTLERRIGEATAAVKWLGQQPGLDHDRMAILGYNQGAIVAAATAGRLGATSPVKSVVLWLPIVNPLYQYSVRQKPGRLQQGLAADGEKRIGVTSRSGTDYQLGRNFYKDVWTISPAAEIIPYRGALLTVMSSRISDVPPVLGEALLRYHTGRHEMMTLDVDQAIGAFDGPSDIDDLSRRTLEFFETSSR